MLKELTVKRQATTLVEVDDSKNVDLVCIQTGEMREQYNKYPEILFVDTTYYVNIEAYPLLTMMVEDGDGRGKLVAYCFQRSETKVNLEKILDYEGCSNMNASSSITFVTYTLRQSGIRFYKGSNVSFKLAPNLKINTVYLLSYSPWNEGHFSILENSMLRTYQ